MAIRQLEHSILAEGLKFPEGPTIMADGSLLVVEMKGGDLVQIYPGGSKRVLAELGEGSNGAALGPDGMIYVCNNGGFNWLPQPDGYHRPHGRIDNYQGGSIQRVDPATGEFEILYSHCGDVALCGPNDIVFDGDGGFWFTDHGKSWDRLLDKAALYYARSDGSYIVEAAFPLMAPNGVGISPDGNTLYATETDTARLWCYPIIGPGELGKQPWPSPNGGQFLSGATGYQRFDSLAVEECGNICVGTLVDGGISVFSPEGQQVDFLKTPDRYCTNICFGGEDMRDAYITLSGVGQVIKARWDRPGLRLSY